MDENNSISASEAQNTAKKMSITQIEIAQQALITELVLANQKLKQERDEAREHLSAVNHFLVKYIAERDEWSAMCGCYKQERDEARAVLREIEAACLHTSCELRMIATRALEAKHDPCT